jgi:arylsulfatase A-like enzyme
VPLSISRPASVPQGVVVREPVSLVDLAPTLLDLAGQPIPVEFAGRSLVDGDRLVARQTRPILSSVILGSGRRLHSIAAGPLRLIIDPATSHHEIYNEVTDPRNQVDLSSQRPQEIARLRAALDTALAKESAVRAEEHHSLDPELAEQLRQLGYLE